MIISKKRFQQEIEKAVKEADEKRWQSERVERVEREAHRRMDMLEERIRIMEKIIESPITIDGVAIKPMSSGRMV